MPDCPKCGTYLEVSVSSTKRGVDVSLVYEVPPPAVAPAPSPAPEKAAKVEPTRAAEVDKFGREIVERLGGAFIVKCEDESFLVSREDGRWFGEAGRWAEDSRPDGGYYRTPDELMAILVRAAKSLKLPTANPAASAKVERDRHGRLIVRRDGHAMVVMTDEEDDRPYLITDFNSVFHWPNPEGKKWNVEPIANGAYKIGLLTKEDADICLPLAASTPLPAAASIETPKVEDECRRMGIRWDTMDAPTTKRDVFLFCAVIDLKRELAELKREVAELKKASQ